LTEIKPLAEPVAVEGEDLPPTLTEADLPEGASLTSAGQGLSDKPLSPGRLAWRRFRRHKLALISAAVLLLLSILIFFPSLVTTWQPTEAPAGKLAGPSREFPLGTSTIGQDQLSRILHGGQISLKVGLAVTLVAGIIGVAIGAVAGYYGRWVDNALMRVTDLFLAIPLLVVLILFGRLPARQAWAATWFGEVGSIRSIITMLALFFWMPMARIVRGQILSLKEKEFVEAARALGASDARILLRHLVPNCTGAIVVNLTLGVAAAILTESALSFLGYGVQSATTPTWGNLLANVKGFTTTAPWLVWFPGLAILITVLCVNYLGDGLRDALDPKQHKNKA
jgi:peptide/nickel transport system permease protein